MPLSGKGLCEALTTPAAATPRRGASAATPGVGRTPRSITFAPPLAAPAAREDESIPPERRVSRPIEIGPPKRRATARPSLRASSGIRPSLATPRTPSVPNVIGLLSKDTSSAHDGRRNGPSHQRWFLL